MVKRKIPAIVLLIIGFFILGIGGFYFYWQKNQSANITSPLSKNLSPNKTTVKEKVLKWQDPLGFSFTYPTTVKVISHTEDNEHYANLELTEKDHKGGVTLIIADAQYPSLEAWLTGLELPLKASVLETEITSSVSAKKIYVPDTDILTTIFFYDDLAYTISTKANSDQYWQKVQKDLLGSFILPPSWEETVENNTDQSTETNDEVAVDEEEVVE